jgi:hypothetical protein
MVRITRKYPTRSARKVIAMWRGRARRASLRRSLKALGASGQLGYGIPEKSLAARLERAPDYIGADMGSIDPGPYYLGSGELATATTTTRADLSRLLRAARKLDIPLLIGTAGSAGAAPHLEKTLAMVREIARADGLLSGSLRSAPTSRAGSSGRRCVPAASARSTAWRR